MVVENHQFLRVSSAAEIRDFNLIGVSLTKPMGDIAENTAVAKKGYELFMAVNIEGFMELIDDSCEWVTSGPQDKLSWVGSYQGRAGVGQFFGKLAEAIEITAFEPREFIAQGDRVVVLGSSTAINKATGKSASQVWAHAITVIDGKIHAFQGYDDTAAAVEAATP